ncbi:MAG: BrnT family toxin [Desulfosarcina sp.]|nr:BrnT family toxin [Desulfobacterales bacterium]
MLTFEWDKNKALSNSHRHKVTLDEASTVFKDTLSLTIGDPLHSQDENRLILLCMSYKNRLLVVIHTERGNNIRIISARKASKKERSLYESDG